MKRLLIVAVFLLAGAVMNVVVAWGCVMFLPYPLVETSQPLPSKAARRVLQAYAPSEWLEIVEAWREATLGRSEVFVRFLKDSEDTDVVYLKEEGWPARSLRMVHRTAESPPPGYEMLMAWELPHAVRYWWRVPEYLPIGPIWPGFIANTLIYASVLLLLISCSLVCRRWLRFRRGLCPACAYPMGESAVCSECGRTLHRAQPASQQRGSMLR